MVDNMEQENETFIKVYVHSPSVLEPIYYQAQLDKLKPEYYAPKPYAIPAPTPKFGFPRRPTAPSKALRGRSAN